MNATHHTTTQHAQRSVDLGDGLVLDLDAMQHVIVEAGSRAGKTNVKRLVVESAADQGFQVVVVDPEGEFATLREVIPDIIIAGGLDADIPLTPENAEGIMRRLYTLRSHVVFDTSESDPEVDQPLIVAAVHRALNRAPKGDWHDLIVLDDEAQRFANKDKSVETKSMVQSRAAMALTASAGLKRGHHMLVGTQRIQSLDNAIVGLANAKLIGRRDMDTDSKRSVSQLGLRGEEAAKAAESLDTLPRGTFYARGLAFNHAGARLVRIKKARTDTPGRGANRRSIPPARSEVLAALRELAIAAPTNPTDDVGEAEIGERSPATPSVRGHAGRPHPRPHTPTTPEPRVVERFVEKVIEKPVVILPPEDLAQLHKLYQETQASLAQAERTTKALQESVFGLLNTAMAAAATARGEAPPPLEPQGASPTARLDLSLKHASKKSAGDPDLFTPAFYEAMGKKNQDLPGDFQTQATRGPRSKSRRNARAAEDDEPDLPVRAGARRMVMALAQHHPRPLTRDQVSFLARVKRSGTFDAYLADLRHEGLTTETPEGLTLTAHAVQLLGTRVGKRGPSKAEVISMWRENLRAGARRMLDVVLASPMRVFTRDELAAEANIDRSGTFDAYLSDLKKTRLVKVDGHGVTANTSMFVKRPQGQLQ